MLTESESSKGDKGGKYVLESLRGFDLFPQVSHLLTLDTQLSLRGDDCKIESS
jgi:hypothetical protein